MKNCTTTAHRALAGVEVSTGRVMREIVLTGNSVEVRVADLAPGVYVGRLLGVSGQVVKTCKVVVIH